MNKCYSQTLMPWLKEQFGKGCLAPLAGVDAAALKAAMLCAELWAQTGHQSAADAFGHVVLLMQEKTRYLAYHAVAHCYEWHAREVLWRAARLPILPRVGVCAYEPGGRERPLEGRAA